MPSTGRSAGAASAYVNLLLVDALYARALSHRNSPAGMARGLACRPEARIGMRTRPKVIDGSRPLEFDGPEEP